MHYFFMISLVLFSSFNLNAMELTSTDQLSTYQPFKQPELLEIKAKQTAIISLAFNKKDKYLLTQNYFRKAALYLLTTGEDNYFNNEDLYGFCAKDNDNFLCIEGELENGKEKVKIKTYNIPSNSVTHSSAHIGIWPDAAEFNPQRDKFAACQRPLIPTCCHNECDEHIEHNSIEHSHNIVHIIPFCFKEDKITLKKKYELKGHTAQLQTLKWHPLRQEQLASGDVEGTIKIWDILQKAALHSMSLDFCINSLAWHPERDLLAVTQSRNNAITVYNSTHKMLEKTMQLPHFDKKELSYLVWNQCFPSELIVVCSDNDEKNSAYKPKTHSLTIMDYHTEKELQSIELPLTYATPVIALDHRGNQIAVASKEKILLFARKETMFTY